MVCYCEECRKYYERKLLNCPTCGNRVYNDLPEDALLRLGYRLVQVKTTSRDRKDEKKETDGSCFFDSETAGPKEALSSLRNEAVQLKSELDKEKELSSQLKNDLAKEREKSSELIRQLDSRIREIDELKGGFLENIDRYLAKAENLDRQFDARKREKMLRISKLKEEEKAKNKELSTLEKEVLEKEGCSTGLDGRIGELRNRLTELDEATERKKAEYEKLQVQINMLNEIGRIDIEKEREKLNEIKIRLDLDEKTVSLMNEAGRLGDPSVIEMINKAEIDIGIIEKKIETIIEIQKQKNKDIDLAIRTGDGTVKDE